MNAASQSKSKEGLARNCPHCDGIEHYSMNCPVYLCQNVKHSYHDQRPVEGETGGRRCRYCHELNHNTLTCKLKKAHEAEEKIHQQRGVAQGPLPDMREPPLVVANDAEPSKYDEMYDIECVGVIHT